MNKLEIVTGVLSGKFSPFHNGHLQFIKQALESCDKLYVMVYDYKVPDRLSIPLKDTAKLIRDIVSNENLVVVECSQPPEKSFDELSRVRHKEYALSHLPSGLKIDKVFCNSKDGIHIANALNAQLVEIDPKRQQVPISSSLISTDFKKYSGLLPKAVKEKYLHELSKVEQKKDISV